jgi:TonB family protein
MNSLWPPALASLDDSLAIPCESLGKLNAGISIDVEEVIQQLNQAAESARKVRELVLSELPEATWQSRGELDALIEEIRKTIEARTLEERRACLLALAAELERGTIVHRRALRVSELNQLRDHAIDELRSQAGEGGTAAPLPGPEAGQWVNWACALKEPEDSEALQTLRQGFAHLDDFIASLEPDMWTVPDPSVQNQRELAALIQEETQKNLRARLLALATELGRGSIVHHRAFRVTQLNQLREQAIEELTSQAAVAGAPQTLPGPEADRWIEWACGLKEPEDAESLQTLRQGFAQLDDFIASLEPDMWVAAGSPTAENPRQPERPADKPHQEPSPRETNGFEETILSSGPLPIKLKATKSPGVRHEWRASHAVKEASPAAVKSETLVAPEEPEVIPARAEEDAQATAAQKAALLTSIMGIVAEPVRRLKHAVEPPFNAEAFREAGAAAPAVAEQPVESAFTSEIFRESAASTTGSDLKARVQELLAGKSRMLLAVAAVLVLIVAGAFWWRSHRNRIRTATVIASESKAADQAPGSLPNQIQNQPVAASDPNAKLPADKQAKPKDQAAAANKPPTTPAPQQAGKPAEVLQPPLTIAKNDAKPVDTSVDTANEAPDLGAMPTKAPAGLISNIPTAQPKLAQKVQVSSGVAQGLLVHQITPRYPPQARQAHVQGTVVLQALIGKDGSVRNLHALSGPPLLTQAAVDAVKQWKYKPYYLDGQPVEAETQISVKFTP